MDVLIDLLKLFGAIFGFLVGAGVLFVLVALAYSAAGPIVGTLVLCAAISLYVTALFAVMDYVN